MAARDIAVNFIQRWNHAARERYNKPLLFPRTDEPPTSVEDYPNCTVQAIRSIGSWSAGLNIVEMSIYKSQLEAIKNAEHYIYIEVCIHSRELSNSNKNQYFISAAKDRINPRNKIMGAILDRYTILLAYFLLIELNEQSKKSKILK